ncbi:hypothetical protein CH63R_07763 [Colletotrichum higginsianum IMI 349063]|uniref:Uncharacterized protein n=1 Tax=Colletotrichum higginsianum (strain IMI 349063) TaxID=759273 RepID=A0A1B7YAT2_COLHI|nr:hypothetical protein CH63R_07763 [Colletotrichum higginsianum IMI 349063]OBR08998.1 hypothetical protein CH63R_07763 [Colletotrichum higginsianum IMI 349063]
MGLYVSADGSVASAKKPVPMIPLHFFSCDSPGKRSYVPRIALLRTSFKTHSHNGDMDRQDIAHVGLSCHSASLHGRAFPNPFSSWLASSPNPTSFVGAGAHPPSSSVAS